MQILDKTLSMVGTRNKVPIKVEIKTAYRIAVMVNNNDIVLGTHAGMLLIGPNIFEIFDPNGSFSYSGIAAGSLRLFPIYDENQRVDVYKKYLEYQLSDGGDVYVYNFFVSREVFFQIEDRILNEEGCSGVLNCSKCISNAITGIGIFKSIPSDIFLPSNLKKELDKISKPLKIIKNNKL